MENNLLQSLIIATFSIIWVIIWWIITYLITKYQSEKKLENDLLLKKQEIVINLLDFIDTTLNIYDKKNKKEFIDWIKSIKNKVIIYLPNIYKNVKHFFESIDIYDIYNAYIKDIWQIRNKIKPTPNIDNRTLHNVSCLTLQ